MIKAVIHCSDSPQGRGDNAQTIHRWHKERGFDGIGYHYVILEDGTVENGRPEFWSGAHAKGHNDAIGICFIGDEDFTEAQFQSLYNHCPGPVGYSLLLRLYQYPLHILS